MTLANLKKREPSVKRPVLSVDEFIDEADFYAKGMSKVIPLPGSKATEDEHDPVFKRATFTLGETAISQLNQLSMVTGIAKSRLIRIWLHETSAEQDLTHYHASAVK